MKKNYFVILSCILFASCIRSDDTILVDLYDNQFYIPSDAIFTCNLKDTISLEQNTKYKIVNYIDSIGCIRCKTQLPAWKNLIDDVSQFFGDKVAFLTIMHPRRIVEAKYAILGDEYPYPVCIDVNDEFNRLNHFPSDDRFHCFLLDENNRVVLIGNPVQNPKIKDLYIRTICERLNIDYKAEKQSNPRIHLGTISKNKTKTVQFEIKNSDKEVLEIDSVYTSCECTTAKISKTEILKNESAILTVTYKPDGIGDFYREIFVKIHDEEKTKIYEIEGNSTEI